MGFAGTLERCTVVGLEHTVAHHQLVEVARIDLELDQLVGNRSVAIEDHPSDAASCVVDHIDQGCLVAGQRLGRCGQLLGAGALLLACERSLPPSSSLSTLCESP